MIYNKLSRLAIIFIISACYISCANNNCKILLDESQLPNAIKLTSKNIAISQHIIPLEMVVIDNHLVIQNMRVDSIFMAFDINDFSKCISWGESGNGPIEYSNRPKLVSYTDSQCAVVDFLQKRIDISNFTEINRVKIAFNNGNIPKTLAINPYTHSFIYDIFTPSATELYYWSVKQEPTVIYNCPDYANYPSTTKLGSMGVNFDKNRIVYAYNKFRRFDILDTLGSIVKTVEITPNILPNKQNTYDLDNYTYYFDIVALKNSFILYYVGHTSGELQHDTNCTTYFEEYDYDGNPLSRYEINQFIRNFVVTKNRQFICETMDIDHPIQLFSE